MGLFGLSFSRGKGGPTDVTSLQDATYSATSSNSNHSAMRSLRKRGSFLRQNSVPLEPSMKHLPDLVLDLKTAVDTSHDRAVGALRKLFALSEHAHSTNRIEMVRVEDGSLVPTLLYFLDRCERGSSEQSLSLLVLNNLSIPVENKRAIALQYDGARILSRMLCEDPSCHLIAIVLVNLTFSDIDLRRELVSDMAGIGLVESLAYALRIASLTAIEYETRREYIEELSTREDLSAAAKLSMLMAEDHQLRPEARNSSFGSGKSLLTESCITDPSQQCFPETAKWCLGALKNATRPCKDAGAAHVLIKSGIFSLILRYITLPSAAGTQCGSPGSSSDSAATTDPPSYGPSTWSSNSNQDSALHIVLNLAACPVSRDYVFEADAVTALSAITQFSRLATLNQTSEETSQQEYQCLKARMAVAFLLGSQGHFGQTKITSKTSTVQANASDSPLVMSEADTELLMELLVNTIERRGKEGPGGYSAVTFEPKFVLFALRCLLTHTANQTRVAYLAARKLNVLLLKVLAQFSMLKVQWMDVEAAEHAVFCLYLQSNYGFKKHGFQQPFLPKSFTDIREHDSGELFAKVLSSYLSVPSLTPAGKHAAQQLLLRLDYLEFEGELSEIVGVASLSVFEFGDDILSQADMIELGELAVGAKPKKGIFDRPIMGSKKPKRGTNAVAPWDNMASVSMFSNALQAVQQLSYGSVKVRHMGVIDDIMIANNIFCSASGERTESYNSLWVWQDKAQEISRHLGRRSPSPIAETGSTLREASSRLNRSSQRPPVSPSSRSPFAFLQCGSLCHTDTTII